MTTNVVVSGNPRAGSRTHILATAVGAPQAAAAEALLRQLLTELGADVPEPGLPVVEAELPAIAEKYAAALRL